MMRSLYSGVTGLRSQQIKMDVLGNNIANVGTAGFKKSRVVFSDKLYQAVRGASRATDARGGTNPMAIGLGTAIFSIDQIHTPYTAQMTNRLTDLAIDGDGYFVIKQSNGETVYTRSGAFVIDEFNNLVTVNGDFVQGWMADVNTGAINATPSEMGNINLNDYIYMLPQATTDVILEGVLNSTTPEVDPALVTATAGIPEDDQVYIFTQVFYDSQGNKYNMYYRFFLMDASTNEWGLDMSLDSTFPPTTAGPPPTFTAGGGAITFTGVDDTTTYRTDGITFDTFGKFDEVATGWSAMNVIIDGLSGGVEPIEFNVDYSALLQYNAKSDADVARQNGNAPGNLISRSIGTDGIMRGSYDNGEIRNMFQIAMASFKNPEGLEQIGSSSWRESANSGTARIGEPGTGPRGKVLPGHLEMSNVDLAEEFVEMIVTQRGFSANSRVITTSDEMLQELVNLKR